MLREWIDDAYAPRNRVEVQIALRQVMQQIALAGLYRAGFFEHAAFYGGTALRIFYGLPRFSEDLDFSLLKPEATFSLSPYLSALEKEFRALGVEIHTREKLKSVSSQIDSAFLKAETLVRDILLEATPYRAGHKERISMKIKLEVDTYPPQNFSTEERLLLKPFSCYIKCFTPEDLMAGKLHALLFRRWKTRVKGRDWFDLEWYIRKGIKAHLEHFKARAVQSSDWEAEKPMRHDDILELLRQKIADVSIERARQDVLPFIRDASVLDVWSKTYFLDLAEHIQTS